MKLLKQIYELLIKKNDPTIDLNPIILPIIDEIIVKEDRLDLIQKNHYKNYADQMRDDLI